MIGDNFALLIALLEKRNKTSLKQDLVGMDIRVLVRMRGENTLESSRTRQK